jgi:hypothetical protein
MEVNVQQSSACNFDTALERTFDMLEVIKPSGPEQIDDQMGPSESNALALDKKVLTVFSLRYTRAFTMVFLLGGA